MEYPDSDITNVLSSCSEPSFSSPPVLPLTSEDDLTDSESEEESEYPDSESSEWSTECSSCSESSSLVVPCFSPLTPLKRQTNLVDEGTVITRPVAESPVVLHQQPPANNTSSVSAESPVIATYKLVGDNIDFSVKARYSRSDSSKDHSVHYFHYMCVCVCVCDRIDFSE